MYISADVCHTFAGRSYLFHNVAMNFQNAVNFCSNQGMILTKIRGSEHNDWLAKTAESIDKDQWWVGITDRITEGVWKNVDNSPVEYTKWESNEPNNLNNEDCVHLGYFGNAQWNDAKCGNSYRVICESESSSCQGQSVLTTLSDGDKCGFYENRGYLFVNRGLNRANAAKYCQERNMKLTNVYDAEHNLWLEKHAKSISNTQWFIGANDITDEGRFINEDGTSPAYTKWYPGEPNNHKNEDCVVLNRYSNGYWNDANCQRSDFRFICESSSRTCNQGSVFPSPLENGDKCGYFRQKGYMFVDRVKNYADASKYCEDRNMKLTSVLNKEHNDWLSSISNRIAEQPWFVGANDREIEGEWLNTDGSFVTYKRWHSGEPNNSGDEDCVHIGYFRNAIPDWNDVACHRQYRFVCESDRKDCEFASNSLTTVPTGDKCSYYGNKGFLFHKVAKSHADAKRYCSTMGMKLASVLDEHHNKWLTQRAFSVQRGKWLIGANDIQTEGHWKNDDGSNVEFTKWHTGEPNNLNNEDCVHLGYFGNEDWNDTPCSLPYSSICESTDKECRINAPNSHCRARGGLTYFFMDTFLNHYDAKLYCQRLNMRLVTVTDSSLDTWLYKTSKYLLNQRTWIGLSDALKEGEWIWHSGSSSTYRNWHSAEPNNSGNEDCVEYGRYEDGSWNDIACNAQRKFICESDRATC